MRTYDSKLVAEIATVSPEMIKKLAKLIEQGNIEASVALLLGAK